MKEWRNGVLLWLLTSQFHHSPMPKSIYQDVQQALIKLCPTEPQGHALTRLNTLSGLVSGMINKGKSQVSQIGTGLPQDINQLSKEIHAKRFLENKHTDYKVHYLPYLRHFIAYISKNERFLLEKQHLHLVIDGSQMGSKFVVLMLSVLVGGQTIPVFWVVKEGKKGHFPTDMHLDVIQQAVAVLRGFMSADTQFTLLGDGEFDSVALQQCCREDLKIDYVVRTACDTILYENGDEFQPKNIRPDADQTTFFIPSVEFSKEKWQNVHFLCWFDNKIYAEPLYLISSMDNAPDIIAAYRQRFKIETLFKNLKSRGFNLHKNRLKKSHAISNLIMIAALAYCFLINFGIQNQDNQLKIKAQRIDKNVNSLFYFAILFLQYLKDYYKDILFCPNLNRSNNPIADT